MLGKFNDIDVLQGMLITTPTKNIKNIELEIISPLAMYGSNREKPYVRATSIKGVMRYWWRVLQTFDSYKELLENETMIFGGTNPYVVKSPINISVSDLNYSIEKRTNLLPHRNKKGRKGFNRNTLKVGGSFQVSLSISPHKPEGIIDKYVKLLELVSLIGSFGQRARRGFGSVQIPNRNFTSVDDYINRVTTLLKELGQNPQKSNRAITLINANQKNLIRLKNVYVGRQTSTVREVLSLIGEASSKYNRDGSLGSISEKNRRLNKLSSPLWCSIKRVNKSYFPIIAEINSKESNRRRTFESNKIKFLDHLGVRID